jgi:RES domain-containing protein
VARRQPRHRGEPPRPRRREPEADGPTLLELERFSHASLAKWLQVADQLGRLHSALYFGLESARRSQEPALLDGLRAGARAGFEFKGWSRIVDYRYTLAPLSVAGSLRREGGRFNIGARLSPGAFTPFPALYLGEDYATAYQERFGLSPAKTAAGLSAAELALRKPDSFTQVQVRGRLDLVLDIGDPQALKPFVEVIKTFVLPANVTTVARQLGLRRPPGLVRSVAALQRQLQHRHWRMLPMQFDLPANTQVFGRMAAAAGMHGILYPSVRHSGSRCLALYPQNWRGSGSFVEVADAVPEEARVVRLDATTGAME